MCSLCGNRTLAATRRAGLDTLLAPPGRAAGYHEGAIGSWSFLSGTCPDAEVDVYCRCSLRYLRLESATNTTEVEYCLGLFMLSGGVHS